MKATLEVLFDQIIPSDELATSVETEQKLCWSSLFQWNGGIAWESMEHPDPWRFQLTQIAKQYGPIGTRWIWMFPHC